jgi:hypothetical protein
MASPCRHVAPAAARLSPPLFLPGQREGMLGVCRTAFSPKSTYCAAPPQTISRAGATIYSHVFNKFLPNWLGWLGEGV